MRLIFAELNVHFAMTHDGSSGSKAKSFSELDLFSKRLYEGRPIVFLFRDPRDTVVSSYFWESNRNHDPYNRTISEFIRDPRFGLEKVVLFNLAWLRRGMHLPAFLPIRYEEMVFYPASVINTLLNFGGVQIIPSKIEKAVTNNQFEALHAREASGERLLGTSVTKKKHHRDVRAFKFRRGKVGGYVDYLSRQDIAYCDKLITQHRYFEESNRLMLSLSSPPDGQGTLDEAQK